MIELSHEQIKSIAGDLECGMRCYLNLKSKEIKTILDFDRHIGADEELWEDEIRELEENWTDYFEIENMTSRESFSVMEDFTEQVEDQNLKDRLKYALNRPKPFQNFKYEIDYSGEYRQKWFDFKSERYIEWVRDQINRHNEMEKFKDEM